MAESEELEPLFDYSRVQPLNFVCLDDEDEPSDVTPIKISKGSKKPNIIKETKEKIVVDCDDKEEEDWLAPPPNVSGNVHKLEEDSTIKELRLKRQELVSFTQSAQDVLRAVEESAKREFSSSLQSLEHDVDRPLKPSSERAKIVISVQDKEGLKQFRIFMDDKFDRLFKMYADKVKLDRQCLAFSFDGDKVSPTETPNSLGMEDDDIIEVHVKSS